jgi:hypothetical protein
MKKIIIALFAAAVIAAAPAALARPVVKQTPRHRQHHKQSAPKHKMGAKGVKRSHPGALGRARSEPKDYSTGAGSNASGGSGGY